MNILSSNRFEIRLIKRIIRIAIVGLVLWGFVRFRSGRPRYLDTIAARWRAAADHQAKAQSWRQAACRVDGPCLLAWRYPNDRDTDRSAHLDQRQPYAYTLGLYDFPVAQHQEFVRCHRDEILALCRERVAYYERMRERWSFAACAPWSDPRSDEAKPPITAGWIADQRY